MFRCDFDVTENLEILEKLNTAKIEDHHAPACQRLNLRLFFLSKNLRLFTIQDGDELVRKVKFMPLTDEPPTCSYRARTRSSQAARPPLAADPSPSPAARSPPRRSETALHSGFESEKRSESVNARVARPAGVAVRRLLVLREARAPTRRARG